MYNNLNAEFCLLQHVYEYIMFLIMLKRFITVDISRFTSHQCDTLHKFGSSDIHGANIFRRNLMYF